MSLSVNLEFASLRNAVCSVIACQVGICSSLSLISARIYAWPAILSRHIQVLAHYVYAITGSTSTQNRKAFADEMEALQMDDATLQMALRFEAIVEYIKHKRLDGPLLTTKTRKAFDLDSTRHVREG